MTELPRQAGSRENRWANLLSGQPPRPEATAVEAVADRGGLAVSELAAVKANVSRLEAEVSALKALVAKISSELGIRG